MGKYIYEYDYREPRQDIIFHKNKSAFCNILVDN